MYYDEIVNWIQWPKSIKSLQKMLRKNVLDGQGKRLKEMKVPTTVECCLFTNNQNRRKTR